MDGVWMQEMDTDVHVYYEAAYHTVNINWIWLVAVSTWKNGITRRAVLLNCCYIAAGYGNSGILEVTGVVHSTAVNLQIQPFNNNGIIIIAQESTS